MACETDSEEDFEATTGRITDAPSVGPTMPPTFNLHEFARDASVRGGGFVLSPETVFEVVPNVSWSSASLDLVEMNVIRHIDGISPLSLLQTVLGISYDELQVMLAMMLARHLVMVVPSSVKSDVRQPSSGVFKGLGFGDLDVLLASTG